MFPGRGIGVIDDLRVAVNPLAGCAQGFHCAFGNRAITAWPDVEHVGAAAGYSGDQALEDEFGSLPVFIIPRVGPGIVRGVHGFPEAFLIGNRHLHVAQRLVVTEPVAGAAADHGIGLVLADHGHEFLDVFLGHVAGRVEPDDFDRPVFAGDFLHLRQAFFGEVVVEIRGLSISIGRGAVVAAGEGPVLIVGVVESETDPLVLASLGEVLHRVVVVGRRLDHVEVVGLRVIHRKTIVVLAGDDDVFHAGILGQLGDRLGVELVGLEGGGEFLVFGDGNIGHLLVHDPLADAIVGLAIHFVAELRIEPPVDEHRVIALIEQLAPLGVVGAELDDRFAPHLVHFLRLH